MTKCTTRRARCLAASLLIAQAALFAEIAGASEPSNKSSAFDNSNHCKSVSRETCIIAQDLGRGINMGNMLEAPREGDWGFRLDPAYIAKAAPAFKNVRIPVRWSNHAAPSEDAALDEFFAARVDRVVDDFLAKGMYVILNMHHYSQLFGDPLLANELEVAPEVLEARYLNMWQQIAFRYKNRSPKLIFELLNEPHGKLKSEDWNQLFAKALRAVRKSNPTRAVMVGPMDWNSANGLQKLDIPADRNIIVTIHNYDPFFFTHQGVNYLPMKMPTGVTCCDAGQRKTITDSLDMAKRWSIGRGYPVYLGEFGSNRAADMASRENYTRIVRDEAESRGFGWAYWEFASSFGVYDPKQGNWVEPIRRALLD